MGYFCPERGFNEEVIELVEKLVPTTRVLWQWTKNKMLPTPAKFHYIFNLRDLSRIWQGMLNVHSNECKTTEQLLNLFKHECCRVVSDRWVTFKNCCLRPKLICQTLIFFDRFINHQDKTWFDSAITRVLKEQVSEDLSLDDQEPYFVDFLQDAPEATGDEDDDADLDAPKIYEEVSLNQTTCT